MMSHHISMALATSEMARMNIRAPRERKSSLPTSQSKPKVKEKEKGEGKATETANEKSRSERRILSASFPPLRLSFLKQLFDREKPNHSSSFFNLAELAGKQEGFQYELSQFDSLKQIGSGAFGRVCLGTHRQTGDKVVLKIISKQHILDSGQLEHHRQELESMNRMSVTHCPFVVRTLGTFQEEKNLYFVMEYVGGGELFSHLKSTRHRCFNEKKARFYVSEIVVALEFIHDKERIIYRDLKPENVLLDTDGHVKLTDFGFAKYLGDSEETFTFCGTADYVAPEVVAGKGYNKLADYWGLGVLTYEMLCGKPPFVTEDRAGAPFFENILKGQYTPPKNVSSDAQNFIARLLTVDPKERLGAKHGIQDIKTHPWLADVDWKQVANRELTPPRLGRFKKGLVNIQSDSLDPYEDDTGIDQSLFEEFDTVLRAEGDSIVARRVSDKPLPADEEGDSDSNKQPQ